MVAVVAPPVPDPGAEVDGAPVVEVVAVTDATARGADVGGGMAEGLSGQRAEERRKRKADRPRFPTLTNFVCCSLKSSRGDLNGP